MCGRYVTKSDPAKIAALFKVEQLAPDVDELGENYNVAPSQRIAIVDAPEGVRVLDVVRWGLLPPWAKEKSIGNRMINARAETVDTKNAYRKPFRTKRCLIPADGFYEWKRLGSRLKQPFYFHREDDEPFAFAGLWERWHGPPAGDGGERETVRTACLITTSANGAMAPVHDRMPVVLAESAWAEWLDPDNHDVERLKALLRPPPDDFLTAYPVPRAVGNVRNNGPHLLDPAPEEELAEMRRAEEESEESGTATPDV